MEPEAIAEEVRRMFLRLADLNATVEEALTVAALLVGKELATYAPDLETARAWLKEHDRIALQACEHLIDSYRREGHPLAARRPH